VKERLARQRRENRRNRPEVAARELAVRRKPERLMKVREYMRDYQAKRKAADPAFALRHRTAAAMRWALKNGPREGSRSLWWQEILGYSVDELRRRLASQFSGDMTWNNHGVLWEIDHIKPIAAFAAITTPDCPAFKEAWAPSNLRPLLKTLNRAKGAKIFNPTTGELRHGHAPI
jgi:hypothetical protein